MYGVGRVEVDLVLQDFLNHDRQLVGLVAAAHVHQRPAAGVEHDHALLDQRGQLEAAAHLVDDPLFLQFVEHYFPSLKYPANRSRSRDTVFSRSSFMISWSYS